jgi:hypothetical protein
VRRSRGTHSIEPVSTISRLGVKSGLPELTAG